MKPKKLGITWFGVLYNSEYSYPQRPLSIGTNVSEACEHTIGDQPSLRFVHRDRYLGRNRPSESDSPFQAGQLRLTVAETKRSMFRRSASSSSCKVPACLGSLRVTSKKFNSKCNTSLGFRPSTAALLPISRQPGTFLFGALSRREPNAAMAENARYTLVNGDHKEWYDPRSNWDQTESVQSRIILQQFRPGLYLIVQYLAAVAQ